MTFNSKLPLGLGRIILEDSRKALKTLDDESIDLVLTDIPYSVSGKGIELDSSSDFFQQTLLPVFREVNRVLKPNSGCYVFCSPPQIFAMKEIMDETGLNYKGLHAWCSRASFYPSSFWNPSWEPVIVYYKGKAKRLTKISKKNLGIDLDGFNYNDSSVCLRPKRQPHPATKPLAPLMKYIIATTNEDDIVLDPFLGSGTTAIACLKSKRRFIGIEINPEYFELAKKKIDDAARVM